MAPALRWAQAALWSVVLFGWLWGMDRWLLGPDLVRGWQRTQQLADVPPELGPLATPAYLPEQLGWPPRQVQFRQAPAQAWWMELGRAEGPQLWIGSGDPPPDLPARACVADGACPVGWHALSRRVQGRGVAVVGTLPPHELRRVLDALVLGVP